MYSKTKEQTIDNKEQLRIKLLLNEQKKMHHKIEYNI